jgi:hypothetical protein
MFSPRVGNMGEAAEADPEQTAAANLRLEISTTFIEKMASSLLDVATNHP